MSPFQPLAALRFILIIGIGLAGMFFPLAIRAQIDVDQKERELEETLENLAETEEAEVDFETYLEELEFYKQHPINLNKTNYEELAQLNILTPQQIVALLDYIDKYGKLISIYELQAVPGFDIPSIYAILPYVTVSSSLEDFHVSFRRLLFGGNYQLFIRTTRILEKQKGYTEPDPGSEASRYLGSPWKIYTRFRYNYSTRISYGFTAEKDAGEEFFKGTQKKGFDFYSAHFYLRDFKMFKAIVVGDYGLNLGQGLIMWSGYGLGKSAFVMNVKKEGRVIRPYTSVNEARFLRGVATTVNVWKDLDVTAYVSYKKVDANVAETDTITDEAVSVSSFLESGFHRTPQEVEDRRALQQWIAGGNLTWETRKYKIGASVMHVNLNPPLHRNLQLYNQFEFSGKTLTNISVDYAFLLKSNYFFGETAISDNGGIATINGVLTSLDPKVDITVVQRYYQRNYQSLYGNAFGESTRPANERGVYFGLSLKPIKHWQLDGYFDVYRHDWLKFRTDAPSAGTDYLLQLTWKPSRQLEMYVRYKSELKKLNAPDDEAVIDYPTDNLRGYVRYHITYKITKALKMKDRVEVSFYDDHFESPERGYMIYHDINFKPLSFPLSFDARYALFDTRSWDTRIYAYENDVLYAFSIPAYYNRGMRYYLTLRYTIVKGLDVWFRIAQTWYANRDTIGSGLEEIDGNKKTEVKAQLRLKF